MRSDADPQPRFSVGWIKLFFVVKVSVLKSESPTPTDISLGEEDNSSLQNSLPHDNYRYLYTVLSWAPSFCIILNSVPDPWHFGTDPDPRISTSDQRIRIRLRILLFSSMTFKMPTTQDKFFLSFFCLVLFECTFTSFFSTIFAWWWEDPDLDPYLWLIDLDPGGPKLADPDPEQ